MATQPENQMQVKTLGRVMEVIVPFSIIDNDHYSVDISDIKSVLNTYRSIRKWAFLCITKPDKHYGEEPHWHIIIELSRNYSTEQVAKWFKIDTDLVKSKHCPADYDDELFRECIYSTAWEYDPKTDVETLVYPRKRFWASNDAVLDCIDEEPEPANANSFSYGIDDKVDELRDVYVSRVRDYDDLTIGDIKREFSSQIDAILSNKAVAFIIYGIAAILLGFVVYFLIPAFIAWLASISTAAWAVISIVASVVFFGWSLLR